MTELPLAPALLRTRVLTAAATRHLAAERDRTRHLLDLGGAA